MIDPKAEEAVNLIERALDSSRWPASWAQAMLYLQHNASKGSAAVLDVVKEGHKLLMDSITGLSPEQAMWKASRDDWSVLETMQHIVAGNKATARRCAALARGELVEDPADEDAARDFWEHLMGPPYTSLGDARADSENGHGELVAFINNVSSETNIANTHSHPAVGPMNCLGWAVFQRAHDGIHTGQIAEIKASDGFPANAAT